MDLKFQVPSVLSGLPVGGLERYERGMRISLFPLPHFCAGVVILAALAGTTRCQDDPDAPNLQALQAFTAWISDYKTGAIRLMCDLRVDAAEVARVEQVIADLGKWNNLTAAKHLFEAAVIDPKPPGARSSTDQIDFHAELQPWKVREIARRHIAAMTGRGIEPWLMSMLRSRNLRGKADHPDILKATAAIQILGLLDTTRALLELLRASTALPPRLRLRAVDVLSQVGCVDLVAHFIGLLRDSNPDMRSAALNSIGRALGPHTDETEHDDVPDEIAKLRDQAIAQMKQLLLRDRIWQVRNACAHNLSLLKSKRVIPVLIAGLKAELKRKKDPWAMDLRIHRILEGMTGINMPAGSSKGWEAFWKVEKDRFRLAKPKDVRAKNRKTAGGRYQKFFSLNLESDALLFVVDFSGSMKEKITLQTEVTSGKPGQTLTKAQLVVDQLKKIVLSLPDGSVFNIVVFSDNVRVWRPNRDGGPAMVKLDDESRDDLLGSFLDSLHPRGPTNLSGALDVALGFAGRGIRDKYYALDYDTIYILSDGAPSWGPVTDKDEIRRMVRETNRLKRMTINAITFGELNDVDFLRALAEENGGRHIHVQ